MRIIVPIKQVPETSSVKMDDETGTMIRDGVEAIVNPLDLYAIETAIRLREARGGEIVVLSMGPPKAAVALREALSMGCDAAVLLSDRAFAGSDTWATSCALAAAIRRIGGFDLILCGERATDGDTGQVGPGIAAFLTGQVGPGIAAFLDLPITTYVAKIESVADGVCRVHRLVEDGYEILEMDLPGAMTVVKEIGDPRLPTLRGKQRARKAEIPTWTAGDLDAQAEDLGLKGSPTRVVKIFRPQVARQCEKVRATDEETLGQAVEQLVAFLRKRELL